MSNQEIANLITILFIIIIIAVNGLIMYLQKKKENKELREASESISSSEEDEEENRLNPNYNCKVIDITNKTSGEIESELKTFLNKNDIDIYGEHGKMFLNDKNIIFVWDKEEEW